MFKDVGKKLMILAKVCAWVLLISSVITGIALWASGYNFFIFPLCVLGGAVSVIGCWPLYAFGQITDDVSHMRRHMSQENETPAAPAAPVFIDLPKL